MTNWTNSIVDHAVEFLVISATFEFSKQFLDDTNYHNEGQRHQNDHRLVGLDFLEGLQDTCEQVETVDDLCELKEECNREEAPPAVAS